MVALTARQSVIIKCNMQASILIGNYEFYYGAGLFCKIRGIVPDKNILPGELMDWIRPELNSFQSGDKREHHLVQLLLNYEVLQEYDEQMQQLLQWGLEETKDWQVNL